MVVAGLAAVWAQAPEDEAARANALYAAGKRVDALPLYEDLAKAHPKEWMYQERLADCLGAKATQLSDPAEVKALRTRERDAAKSAVELGDPNYFAQLLAKTDPDAPLQIAPASPGGGLLQEGEKAFTAGDYSTALAKYAAAAEADPQLYIAPLFADDTAYEQRDLKTAAKWFARAIEVNPNRETAYRYWGDALLRIGNDPAAAQTQVPRRHCGRALQQTGVAGIAAVGQARAGRSVGAEDRAARGSSGGPDEAKQYHHQHQP